MAHVRISINDLKCISQADSMGKDDVYWVANLRSAPAVDAKHTNMTTLVYDDAYASSLPEMARIGAGESRKFNNAVVYDRDVPAGSYVFGTIHLMERDTALAGFVAKLSEAIGIIVAGLVIAALVGFGLGYWMGGPGTAFLWAMLAVVLVGLIGFFVGAVIGIVRPTDSDAHLGGMQVRVGPIANPPPQSDKETWKLTLIPSGKLDVVDAHGAELIVYSSTHTTHGTKAGHKYETSVNLEITGGHR